MALANGGQVVGKAKPLGEGTGDTRPGAAEALHGVAKLVAGCYRRSIAALAVPAVTPGGRW